MQQMQISQDLINKVCESLHLDPTKVSEHSQVGIRAQGNPDMVWNNGDILVFLGVTSPEKFNNNAYESLWLARYSRVAPNSTEIKFQGGTGMSARQVFKSYNKGHVNEFDQFVLDERVNKYSGTAADLIRTNFNEVTKGVSDFSTEAADNFVASLKGVMMEVTTNGIVSGHFQGWEPNPEKPGFNKLSNDGKRATQATYDLVTLEIKDPAQFTIVG